jgi:hypothetical protein
MSSNASKKASGAAMSAEDKKLALQQQMWEQQQHNIQPFLDYGGNSLGGLGKLMGGDYSGFLNSPEFKARVGFANDQFNNGAAAKFRLFSGGAQNDRDELNQNLAAQGLGDYRNFLQWGANLGQNAAAGYGQAAQNYANQAGNAYGAIGAAQGANALTQANVWNSTLGGLAGLVGANSGSPFASSYGNNSLYGSGSNYADKGYK